MSLLGKRIKLKGITAKGKNRIREHGDTWTVLAETDRVLFSPTQQGPWLFITPKPAGPGLGQDDKASRWVHLTSDFDFTVMPLDT